MPPVPVSRTQKITPLVYYLLLTVIYLSIRFGIHRCFIKKIMALQGNERSSLTVYSCCYVVITLQDQKSYSLAYDLSCGGEVELCFLPRRK
jgi:hypothetical protein